MPRALSAANPCVLLLDGHGATVRSSACCEVFAPGGFPRGSRAWEQLLAPRDAAAVRSVLAGARTSQFEAKEHGWVTTGSPLSTQWSALTIPNPSGVVELVVLTAFFEPAYPGAPRTTRSSSLLIPSPFAMWAFDRATLRFLAVNGAATDAFGYSRAELEAMRITDLTPWREVPALVEGLTELEPEVSTRARWERRRKDGRLIEIDAEVLATESRGRPICLVLALGPIRA